MSYEAGAMGSLTVYVLIGCPPRYGRRDFGIKKGRARSMDGKRPPFKHNGVAVDLVNDDARVLGVGLVCCASECPRRA